jgi:putative ABC transport system ATP-binding protein
MDAVLSFRDVRKVYAQGRRLVSALDGVSLDIPPREFVCVMGPSGSGKSTLLHLAGGLDVPTSGEVVVAGRATRSMSDLELTLLRRRSIGFVFQFFNLVPSLTVLQNAVLPALLDGRAMDELRPGAVDRLRAFGLGERLDHHPDELSGGEMQRVAVARALAAGPSIVLADEPTGNLDSAAGRGILELFRDVARERTVVMVTHDDRAAAYGTRTVRIRDGRLE